MKNRTVPKKKKKMALYEVLSKGLSKPRRNSNLGSAEHAGNSQPGSPVSGVRPLAGGKVVTKPRMFQINRGKVEITMPSQLAVAFLLLLAVIILVAYRLGERQGFAKNQPDAAGAINESSAEQAYVNQSATAESQNVSNENIVNETAQTQSGDNWLVIASHKDKEQLIRVQSFFLNAYDIETQIRQQGQLFILHTKKTFGDPGKKGTDGWYMKQKIIEIGLAYEPPAGYGNFDFRTVYGMKSID